MTIDDAHIEQIVEKTVNKTLTRVGLFVDDPREMQGMMYYLRSQYNGSTKNQEVIRHTFLSFSVPALMIALWEGAKRALGL